MIVPDVNLLVYAVNEESPLNLKAREWLQDTLSGTESVGLSWSVLLGFVRLSTRAGVLAKPLSIRESLELTKDWLNNRIVEIVEPGPNHFELLGNLLIGAGTAGNLTSDAHLAAIAIAHDAEIHSTDTDFDRFAGLRWRNPL